MKYCFPEISNVFDTGDCRINTIIIENTQLLFRMISDIQNQLNGNDGIGVLSNENEILRMDKNAEMLDRFVPFSLNQKPILTKINALIEKGLMGEDYYVRTMELIGTIETFLYEISGNLQGDIELKSISPTALIKASEVQLCDEYGSLGEKILDYMEIVNEYIGEKVFFTLNLRAFLDDKEAKAFMKSVLYHGFHCIMIECVEKTVIDCEKRYIVDSNLCEIM